MVRVAAVIITSYGIIIGKERIDGRYSIIGGGKKSLESLENAAKREVKEETGLTVTFAKHIGGFDNPNNKFHSRTEVFLVKVSGTISNLRKSGNGYIADSTSNELLNLGFLSYKAKNLDSSKFQGNVTRTLNLLNKTKYGYKQYLFTI